jgi:hypothetical protein
MSGSSPRYVEVSVHPRFNGPPSSGNGGYSAGLLAEHVDGPTTRVTLRRPPPLGVTMLVSRQPDGARMTHDGAVVAEGEPAGAALEVVDPVAPDVAAAAMAAYPGLRAHPFPTCFACGVDRAEGEGLRIFPGPVGDGHAASTWVPHASLVVDGAVPVPVVWAALDCVGAWAISASPTESFEERPAVLGRITARVDARPRVGETHVVVGRHLSTDGRKYLTASTIYDEDGRVVAQAEHVWVQVDPGTFG